MTTQGQKKTYDPKDTTLKIVNRPDDLNFYLEDPYSPRAEISCGHAVTPDNLTQWCCHLLKEGQYKFKCPVPKTPSKDGTEEKCNKEWSYQEVRRLALLTAEERQYFEEKIIRLAATEYCEFKACPGCQSYVERQDLTNLNVRCTVCTADKKKVYEFCWQCLKPWKGSTSRSDRCDNDGCINQDLELLKNCENSTLTRVQGIVCPSIRACPTCGQRVEHDKTGCKNITCTRCRVEFCFLCLKLTPECRKTSSYFIACSDGVAPRQTSIPVWRKN